MNDYFRQLWESQALNASMMHLIKLVTIVFVLGFILGFIL